MIHPLPNARTAARARATSLPAYAAFAVSLAFAAAIVFGLVG